MHIQNKEDISFDKNEIRRKTNAYRISLILLATLELFFIWVFISKGVAFVFPFILIPLMFVFSTLNFYNEKMIYDEKGITFQNLFKKQYFYSWDKIVSVEDTYTDRRVIYFGMDILKGRVLKVGFIDVNGKVAYMSYFYIHHIGIPRFLDYFLSYQNGEQKYKNTTGL